MNVAWLFLFFVAFGTIGAVAIVFVPRGHRYTKKKRPFLKIGVACVALALVSLFLCVGTFCFSEETTDDEVIEGGNIRIVYLAGLTLEGKSDYLLSSDDEYQFFYYDDNNKVQVGHAPMEDSNKYSGDLDGKACVVVTTTPHQVWKRWLCFGYNASYQAKAYDFYIP